MQYAPYDLHHNDIVLDDFDKYFHRLVCNQTYQLRIKAVVNKTVFVYQ